MMPPQIPSIASLEPTISPGELKIRREVLEILWRRGLGGQNLLREHTSLIDAHVVRNFQLCAEGKGMALVALGGYGRQELFPYSDIDLLLLHDGRRLPGRLDTVAQAVFYPLWDAGLEVGHSVRAIQECLADAGGDFFLQVALLDTRFLAGDMTLFQSLEQQYRATYIDGKRQDFLEQMICHREDRHRRFGQHAYLLEPQLKEGRGGLRDVQSLLWTAKVVFSLPTLDAIREAGIFSDTEHRQYEAAREQLIEVRNRLHYLCGRKNDQLFMVHQEEISQNLGYRNTGDLLDVEHFMRDLFRNMQAIAASTDLFFEHADEVLGGRRYAADPRQGQEQALEQGITIRAGRLCMMDPGVLRAKPELILRIFLHMARSGLPIHHRTRRAIQKHLHLVDDEFLVSRANARCFLELLSEAAHPAELLETMMECSVLSAYLPEFGHLDALAQHDVYHVYTVDRHLIQTVGELKAVIDQHGQVFARVSSPAILFLAALFHDIGKGCGRDHSEAGSELARQIGRRLHLSAPDLDALVFLVGNHLFLTDTALRRDLEDQRFLAQCAERVGNGERLAILYLLSIADARATGPSVWNEWKDALLLELYLKLAVLLDGADRSADGLAQGLAWVKAKVAPLLPDPTFDLDALPGDYLFAFSPEEVGRHVALSRGLARDEIAIFHHQKASSWNLLVITTDRAGLLSRICGVIAIHGLKVLAAQIFTWPDGTVVDSLDVRPLFPRAYSDQDWDRFAQDMKQAVACRLGIDYRLATGEKQLATATARHGRRRSAEVHLDNQTSEQFTVIEVYADDRPGLLYDVTRALAELSINIHRAKVSTDRDQAVAVFYAVDGENRKISGTEFQDEIRNTLLFCAGQTGAKP